MLNILGHYLSKYFLAPTLPFGDFIYICWATWNCSRTHWFSIFSKSFFPLCMFHFGNSIGVISSSLIFSLAMSNLSLTYPIYLYSNIVIFFRSTIWVFLFLSFLCLAFWTFRICIQSIDIYCILCITVLNGGKATSNKVINFSTEILYVLLLFLTEIFQLISRQLHYLFHNCKPGWIVSKSCNMFQANRTRNA